MKAELKECLCNWRIESAVIRSNNKYNASNWDKAHVFSFFLISILEHELS